MTDQQLLSSIARGSSEAFAEVYNHYREEFVGFVRKHFVGDDDAIFDLYQDSCMALYSNILSGRLTADALTRASLKTYLFKVGYNKLVDMYRRANTRSRRAFIDNFDYTTFYDDCDDELTEREVVVRRAVEQMAEPCATILRLYYWDDRSMKEIASEGGYSSADSAKSQKSKCMAKLKAYLVKLL